MITLDRNVYTNLIGRSTPEDLLGIVQKERSLSFLKSIAAIRFQQDAYMNNNKPLEPFVRWGAINVEPEAWLPITLGKIAEIEAQRFIKGSQIVVATIPNSATWYQEHLKCNGIFKNASYPPVLKEPNEDANYTVAPVLSYVHNRLPDGTRTPHDVYIYFPGLYQGKTVILVDDAIAEGTSIYQMAKKLKELGARFIIAVAPLAKAMQGGITKLYGSGVIDKLVVLITVTRTTGQNQPMEFCAGLPWEAGGQFFHTLPHPV